MPAPSGGLALPPIVLDTATANKQLLDLSATVTTSLTQALDDAARASFVLGDKTGAALAKIQQDLRGIGTTSRSIDLLKGDSVASATARLSEAEAALEGARREAESLAAVLATADLGALSPEEIQRLSASLSTVRTKEEAALRSVESASRDVIAARDEEAQATEVQIAKVNNFRGVLGDLGDLYGQVGKDVFGLTEEQFALGDALVASTEKAIAIGAEFGALAGVIGGALGLAFAAYAQHQQRAREATEALKTATEALRQAQADYARQVTISGERDLDALREILRLSNERTEAEKKAAEANEGFFEGISVGAASALNALDDLAGGYGLLTTAQARALEATEELSDATRDAQIGAEGFLRAQGIYAEAAKSATDALVEQRAAIRELDAIGTPKTLQDLRADASDARYELDYLSTQIAEVQSVLSAPVEGSFLERLAGQAAKARALYQELPRLLAQQSEALSTATAAETALETARAGAAEKAKERAKAAREEANELARLALGIGTVYDDVIAGLQEDAEGSAKALAALTSEGVKGFFDLADEARTLRDSDPWSFLSELEESTAIEDTTDKLRAMALAIKPASRAAQTEIDGITQRLSDLGTTAEQVAKDSLTAAFSAAFSAIASGADLTFAGVVSALLQSASASLSQIGAEMVADGALAIFRGARLSIQSAGLDPRGPALVALGTKEALAGAALGAGGVVAGLAAGALGGGGEGAATAGGGSAQSGGVGVPRSAAQDTGPAALAPVVIYRGGGPGSVNFVTGSDARGAAEARRELGAIQRTGRPSAPGVRR